MHVCVTQINLWNINLIVIVTNIVTNKYNAVGCETQIENAN
jgi:hypothetical protein